VCPAAPEAPVPDGLALPAATVAVPEPEAFVLLLPSAKPVVELPEPVAVAEVDALLVPINEVVRVQEHDVL
jgi:hypothetical protein